MATAAAATPNQRRLYLTSHLTRLFIPSVHAGRHHESLACAGRQSPLQRTAGNVPEGRPAACHPARRESRSPGTRSTMAAARGSEQTDPEGAIAHRHRTEGRFGSAAAQMAATSGRLRVTSMYVLDTNIISELRRARPHGGVLAWLRSIDDRHLHLSAVSFGEIQAGIERTRDADPAKAAELEAWADQIAETWNVLPMDAAT